MEHISKSAARSISKLSNKIRRKIESFSHKGNFSGTQGKVLHFILAQTNDPLQGDLFQKDIEEEFCLRPPTATELLKKMEANGLIRREVTSYDARLKKIIASEKAMLYKDQVVNDLTSLDQALTKGISPEELELFLRIANRMLENLS